MKYLDRKRKEKETLAREGKEKKKHTTRANGFETPPPPRRAFLRALRELWAQLPHWGAGAAVGVWSVSKGQKGCLRSPCVDGLA